MKLYQADATMQTVLKAAFKGHSTFAIHNELDRVDCCVITYNHITKAVTVLFKDGRQFVRILDNTTDQATDVFRSWIHRTVNETLHAL